MTIDTVLLAIENFRSQIESWGISNEALWVAGALALVVFVYSLREVMTWFLKIQSIAEDLRELRREVRDLKSFMAVAREVSEIAMSQKPNEVEKEKAPSERFPFDH